MEMTYKPFDCRSCKRGSLLYSLGIGSGAQGVRCHARRQKLEFNRQLSFMGNCWHYEAK